MSKLKMTGVQLSDGRFISIAGASDEEAVEIVRNEITRNVPRHGQEEPMEAPLLNFAKEPVQSHTENRNGNEAEDDGREAALNMPVINFAR